MDYTQIFTTADELAEFCCLPDNAAQDARIAERLAELAKQGIFIKGMQCNRERHQH